MGHGGNLWHFENAWVRVLEGKNCELLRAGRKELTRFKAADCSSRVNEFEGWSSEEQRCFLGSLLRVFARHNLAIFSYTLELKHISEEMVGTKGKEKEVAYALLLHNLMVMIGKRVLGDPRFPDRIALIHDRTTGFDSVLLDAFNAMRKDESFIYKDRFTTIAPMGWGDCILLQPADFLAYENFKIGERKRAGASRRKVMDELLDLGSIGGTGIELTRDWVKEINEKQTEEDRQSLYEIARIAKPQC